MARRKGSHADQLVLNDPLFGVASQLEAVRRAVAQCRSLGLENSGLRRLAVVAVYVFGSERAGGEILDETDPEALSAMLAALASEFPLDLPRLDRANVEAVRMVLDCIRDLVFTAGGGDAFGHVLGMFPDGDDGFRTPPRVASLLAQLVDVQPGDLVYDPISIAGELLVAAAVLFDRPDKRLKLRGSTPGTPSRSVSEMNLALRCLQAELDPDALMHVSTGGIVPAMRIVANPPFNREILGVSDRPWTYAPPPRDDSNYAWLQHILDCLCIGGRAAVVMANGALASSAEYHIRRGMVRAGAVEAIIAVPSHVLTASTSIAASIWLLHKTNPEPRSILLIDASEKTSGTAGLSPDASIAIAAIVQQWRTSNTIDAAAIPATIATISDVEAHDYNLSPSRYLVRVPRTPELDWPVILDSFDRVRRLERTADRVVPLSDQIKEELKALQTASLSTWMKAPLKKICRLSSGANPTEIDDGGVAVVKPSDLRLHRMLAASAQTDEEHANRSVDERLRSGDLLVTTKGTVGRVALATAANEGWLFNGGFVRLRLLPGVEVLPEYLLVYLTHPHIQDWMRRYAGGTGVPGLTVTALRLLPVEVPPREHQQRIIDTATILLDRARAHQQAMDASTELHRAMLPGLFGGYEPSDARRVNPWSA